MYKGFAADEPLPYCAKRCKIEAGKWNVVDTRTGRVIWTYGLRRTALKQARRMNRQADE